MCFLFWCPLVLCVCSLSIASYYPKAISPSQKKEKKSLHWFSATFEKTQETSPAPLQCLHIIRNVKSHIWFQYVALCYPSAGSSNRKHCFHKSVVCVYKCVAGQISSRATSFKATFSVSLCLGSLRRTQLGWCAAHACYGGSQPPSDQGKCADPVGNTCTTLHKQKATDSWLSIGNNVQRQWAGRNLAVSLAAVW